MNIAALAERVIAETGVVAVIRCGYQNGIPRLSFAVPDGTSYEQRVAVSEIVDAWPGEQARLDMIAGVDAWFRDRILEGYATEYGWKLGLDQSDVALLTGHYVLAKEAAAIGLQVPPIVDASGVPRSLQLDALTRLMLGYGAHRAALSAEYAQRMAEVPPSAL